MAIPTEINILSLCSGIGGLDLGTAAALRRMGYAPRTVCYVEIEAYAAAVLAARMEDGRMDAAPIWSNLKTFPSAMFRGHIDMVIGGYPCQPFSVAGKRRGEEDPRHLWPFIREVIQAVGPSLCFFENVRGHLNLGFSTVKRELEELGFSVECGIFSAAEVGAPHRRERLFILAHRKGGGCGVLRESSERAGRLDGNCKAMAHPSRNGRNGSQRETGSGWGVCETGDAMADAEGNNGSSQLAEGESIENRRAGFTGDVGALANPDATDRRPHEPEREPEGRNASGCTGEEFEPVGNASTEGLQRGEQSKTCNGNWGGQKTHESTLESSRTQLPTFPPGPRDREAWARILAVRPDLAPAVESQIRGMAHGVSNRVDELICLGGAVVPATAELALRTLWGRIA